MAPCTPSESALKEAHLASSRATADVHDSGVPPRSVPGGGPPRPASDGGGHGRSRDDLAKTAWRLGLSEPSVRRRKRYKELLLKQRAMNLACPANGVPSK